MEHTVLDMVKEFCKRNANRRPEAIIYYRDGVADSQFPIVLQHEYTAFRRVRRAKRRQQHVPAGWLARHV
jgi:hypothetical protein